MHRKISSILIVLFTLLFLNAQSLTNFVICFGEDGHIEIEIADEDQCYHPSSETFKTSYAAFSLPKLDYHETYCKTCVDLPFSCSDEMISSITNQLPKAKVPVLSLIELTQPSFAETKSKSYSNLLQSTHPFTLKTIILLI